MRISAILLALLYLSCASPGVDPSVVSALTIEYGRFEMVDGEPRHIETTDQIRCELGSTFGVLYRITFSEGTSGELPIAAKWRHPAIDAPRSGIRGTVSPSPPLLGVPHGTIELENAGLWAFTDPAELVAGRYEFVIELRDGSTVLLEREFEITGCDEAG
jgi:hypothetical protein